MPKSTSAGNNVPEMGANYNSDLRIIETPDELLRLAGISSRSEFAGVYMDEVLRLSLGGSPYLEYPDSAHWVAIQKHAQRYLLEFPVTVRPAPQGSQANPVSGQFKERELLGCILQPSSAADRDKFDGLKVLIIRYALSTQAPNSSLFESCAEVRKGLKLNPPHRREVFERLPSFMEQDYIGRLSEVLRNEASRPSLNETKKRYIRALGRLVGLSLCEVRPRKTTVIKNRITSPSPIRPLVRPVRSTMADPELAVEGLYEVLEPLHEGFDASGESEVSTVFEQVVDQTEFGFDVELQQKRRKSAYWLEQSTLVSAVNRGVLVPPECRRLTEVLKSCLASQDQLLEFCGGLLSLSYLTSSSLAQLLRDWAGNEVTVAGEFVRVFPETDIAGIVVHGLAAGPKEVCRSIHLSLPSELERWLSRHVSPEGQLSMPAGFESESLILEKCRSILSSARDSGRFNLTESRVRHSLRKQLSLSPLGALAVYLLTGGVEERPPVLIHYVSVDSMQLLEYYREAREELWP